MIVHQFAAATVFVLFAGAAYGQTEAASLPADCDLDMALTTPFDEHMPVANAALSFKMMREVKKDGTVLVPKDATVSARLTRIQKQASWVRSTKRTYYIVGLQIVSVNIGEKTIPVVANLETVPPTAMNWYFIPLSHGPDKWGEFGEYRFQFNVPPPQPGESFLGVVREGLKLPKGLRLVFRTVG